MTATMSCSYLTHKAIRRVGSLCLAPHLMHSRAETNRDNRVYWDSGPKAIDRFMEHHAKMCRDNKFCNDLGLRLLKVVAESESGKEKDEEDSESDGVTVITPRRHRRNPHNKGFPTP